MRQTFLLLCCSSKHTPGTSHREGKKERDVYLWKKTEKRDLPKNTVKEIKKPTKNLLDLLTALSYLWAHMCYDARGGEDSKDTYICEKRTVKETCRKRLLTTVSYLRAHTCHDARRGEDGRSNFLKVASMIIVCSKFGRLYSHCVQHVLYLYTAHKTSRLHSHGI